jgi:Cu+-exporting ATPase
VSDTTPPEASARVYEVHGMTCATCAKRVEKALGKVEGVRSASVDLVRERARVVGTAHEHELREAVTKAGYELVVREDAAPPPSGALHPGEGRALAAVVLTVLVLGIDLFFPHLVGTLTPWLSLAVGGVVAFGLGAPFFVRAIQLARRREANMDTLVALGAFAAMVGSLLALLFPHQHVHGLLDDGGHGHSDASTAALVVAIVLAGKAFEARAKRRAAASLDALAGAEAVPVRVRRHGVEAELSPGELREGDVVLVRPFARVPADGTLESALAYLDESFLTGESRPAKRQKGDRVVGGSVNGASPLEMLVTAVGAASVSGQLEAETAEALAKPPREAELADRASGWVAPIVLVAAIAAFVGWLVVGRPPLEALRTAISVLVVACPCALGLATPAALVAALGRAAREGVLVRDAGRFVQLADVRTLLFDKTGTLTEGKPRLADVISVGARTEREVLELVASVEGESEHPLGRALFLAAMDRGIAARTPTNVRVLVGEGVVGELDGREIRVVAPRAEALAALPEAARVRVEARRREGYSLALVAIDGVTEAVLTVRDRVRDHAIDVVKGLVKERLTLEMISGDHPDAAHAVAEEVGLPPEHVHAGLSPQEKTALVERAQAHGLVAMVGDGVNDAPALARADVGVAIGKGASAALRAGAITLVDGDLGRLLVARALARQTRRTIGANLAWAFGYNALAVPLAAFGALDRLGGPAVAAAAMAGSSILVLLWSLRLSRVSLAYA